MLPEEHSRVTFQVHYSYFRKGIPCYWSPLLPNSKRLTFQSQPCLYKLPCLSYNFMRLVHSLLFSLAVLGTLSLVQYSGLMSRVQRQRRCGFKSCPYPLLTVSGHEAYYFWALILYVCSGDKMVPDEPWLV